MTKLVAGAIALLFVGIPLSLQAIDPIGDVLKAGGIVGLEITVIVLGFFITIAMFRLLGTATKSSERRIDALIEANEAFTGSALKTIETVGRLRQEAMQREVSLIRADIAGAQRSIDNLIDLIEKRDNE